MSKLDRYIIVKFLGTFAFMLGVFCLVVVVFDLMERLGRLIEHDAPCGMPLCTTSTYAFISLHC